MLATSCEELTHWKRLWRWEGLGAGGKGDDRGWDGWMASLTRWVWVNTGSWWWTGRPCMLQFMGLQRIGQDWATELNTLYPWYNVMKMLLYFWDPPQPNLITLVESWEKHYTNSESGTSYDITWPLLLKTDKVIKTKEILKNFHNLEEPKDVQCNLVSWIWSWNRKRALDKKSEYTIS